tara:strand:+ start:608 stop:1120 length:513 start_codon:yes stop_codon:yes gene_type:complete
MKILTLKTPLTHTRGHFEIIISGAKTAVDDIVRIINKVRLDYCMDYADLVNHENGNATADYIVHRQDFRKAKEFVKSQVKSINDSIVDGTIELEYPKWVTDGNTEGGASISFCSSCIDTAVKKENGIKDGDTPQESDGPLQCDNCYTPLASTLVECGSVLFTLNAWKVSL